MFYRYRTIITKPLIPYTPLPRLTKMRDDPVSAFLNLTVRIFAGFSSHVITGDVEPTLRLPAFM